MLGPLAARVEEGAEGEHGGGAHLGARAGEEHVQAIWGVTPGGRESERGSKKESESD